jgi:hypothetical protein
VCNVSRLRTLDVKQSQRQRFIIADWRFIFPQQTNSGLCTLAVEFLKRVLDRKRLMDEKAAHFVVIDDGRE